MRAQQLSQADHERIAAAIRKAELGTSGEIFCVLAKRSDDYFFVSGFMAAASVLIAMVITGYVVDFGWREVPGYMLPLAGFGALAAALCLLYYLPGLRIFLVPRYLRYRRASANAVRQFLSRNIHRTAARTGVLIFLSLEERYAEIVADSGIDDVVDQKVWNGIVAKLIDSAARGAVATGYIEAIGAVGALLAENFPADDGGPNELDDHLAEI